MPLSSNEEDEIIRKAYEEVFGEPWEDASHRLTDLEISEISAVDFPANRRRFLIVKREEGHEVRDTAYATIEKLARQKLEQHEVLSLADGVVAVIDEAPALYRKYREQLRAGVSQVPARAPAAVRKAESPAFSAIEKAATQLQEAAALHGQTLNHAEAVAKACENDPSLYQAYRLERRQRLGRR